MEIQILFLIAGFLNVIGLIDGTLVEITSPSENSYQFVDRHRNHSIAVQGIVNYRYDKKNIVLTDYSNLAVVTISNPLWAHVCPNE